MNSFIGYDVKYVLDRKTGEVRCDISEVAKEILNQVIKNLSRNAEEGVVLVKDNLNRAHVAVKRTGLLKPA